MAFKYLVYDNPEGTTVAFVTDTDGKPRVYDDLEMARECADNQTNGYVIPLGWDPIDALERIQKLGEVTNTTDWGALSPEEEDALLLRLRTTGEELAAEFAEVTQQSWTSTATT
jgi:hypothetical protein